MNAVYSGTIGAGTALAMYFSGGATSAANVANGFASLGYPGHGATVALGFSARNAGSSLINTVASSIMPSMYFPITGNFGISPSPIAMMTSGISSSAGGGFRIGIGITAHQKIGNWTLSAGFSTGEGMGDVFGGVSYDDGTRGFSYHQTAYMAGDRQRTGIISGKAGDWSLRWENDFMGDRNDRFRSNATELGFGDYVIGANVYTNDNDKERTGYNPSGIFGKQLWQQIVGGGTKYYEGGKQLSSPFYVGKRTGRGITRIGYNHPFFGDLIQNGAHWIVNSPYFNKGDYSSPFIQQGTYTPYSFY